MLLSNTSGAKGYEPYFALQKNLKLVANLDTECKDIICHLVSS